MAEVASRGCFTRQRFFAIFSGMSFHFKRFLGGVAEGGGSRSAAPKTQEALNERLPTNLLEPRDAKLFKPNLRGHFYSTENSEEPRQPVNVASLEALTKVRPVRLPVTAT
jgi:hypothetical protein